MHVMIPVYTIRIFDVFAMGAYIFTGNKKQLKMYNHFISILRSIGF